MTQCPATKTFSFKDEDKKVRCEKHYCHTGPCVFDNPFVPGVKIEDLAYNTKQENT
jgi:hypothetical protein